MNRVAIESAVLGGLAGGFVGILVMLGIDLRGLWPVWLCAIVGAVVGLLFARALPRV